VAAKKEKGCKNPHTSEEYRGVSPQFLSIVRRLILHDKIWIYVKLSPSSNFTMLQPLSFSGSKINFPIFNPRLS
jgi:hypothetical protein